MAIEVYEKWLEYYDDNGLSWLATQVQASIKQAFFAGYEAAEQERGADGYDFTDPNDNPYILSGEELDRAVTAARSR
jgi:hypothetical protein